MLSARAECQVLRAPCAVLSGQAMPSAAHEGTKTRTPLVSCLRGFESSSLPQARTVRCGCWVLGAMDVTRAAYPPYDVTPDGQRFLLNVPDASRPLLYIRGIKRMLER